MERVPAWDERGALVRPLGKELPSFFVCLLYFCFTLVVEESVRARARFVCRFFFCAVCIYGESFAGVELK